MIVLDSLLLVKIKSPLVRLMYRPAKLKRPMKMEELTLKRLHVV